MKYSRHLTLFALAFSLALPCQANKDVQIAAKAAHENMTGGTLGKLYKTREKAPSDERREMVVKACVAGLYAIGDVKNAKKIQEDLDDGDFPFEFTEVCGACDGAGAQPKACVKCKGAGRCTNWKCHDGMVTSQGLDGRTSERKCATCNGTGACSKCKGKGSVASVCKKCKGAKTVVKKSSAMSVCKDLLKQLSVPEEGETDDGDAEGTGAEGAKADTEKKTSPKSDKAESRDDDSIDAKSERAKPEPEAKSSCLTTTVPYGSDLDAEGNVKEADVSIKRVSAILRLAEAAVREGETLGFHGFFPGMSRYDAQSLAMFYKLDGNDCQIQADGENAVYKICLTLGAMSKVLKMLEIKGLTLEEVFQEVANAVGDLEVWKDRGGSRVRASRILVNGTCMNFDSRGIVLSGGDGVRTKPPLETVDSKEQRIKAADSIISHLLDNMVAIPVRGSGMKPFKMGRFEVTQTQWVRIMGKNPSQHMSAQIGSVNNGIRPVENVSWEDCQDFLKELNSLPEVKKTGLEFRLPTAREWEYACRAGAVEGVCRLADGTEVLRGKINDVAWIEVAEDLGERVKPSGLKQPNAFGLFDMIGNVSEWTLSKDSDRESGYYIRLGGAGVSKWSMEDSKTLWREYNSASYRSDCSGFRLCASKRGVANEDVAKVSKGAEKKMALEKQVSARDTDEFGPAKRDGPSGFGSEARRRKTGGFGSSNRK